jgi:hypothetical protein
MNPMGRPHVNERLAQLLALGAGAWPNRFVTETGRFAAIKLVKYGWFTSRFFVSSEPSATLVRQNVVSGIYRTLYLERYGAPRRLRQMMEQEGRVGNFANIPVDLDADDLAYSSNVMERRY